MKILFLDVDGVLNNMPGSWDKQPDNGTFVIDQDNVQWLNKIIGNCNPTIVMSSTWAMFDDHMEYLLQQVPQIKPRLHKNWRTPRKLTSTRGQEIGMWMADNAGTFKSWCVLDDATDHWLAHHHTNVVRTLIHRGLTEPLADRAIEILGVKND